MGYWQILTKYRHLRYHRLNPVYFEDFVLVEV